MVASSRPLESVEFVMRKILLALSVTAALGVVVFAAAPASAAPFAATQHAAHQTSHVQQAHYRHHPRRHFWTPWRFAYRNCFPIRHGYVCYY
jgi:hypothetical protein